MNPHLEDEIGNVAGKRACYFLHSSPACQKLLMFLETLLQPVEGPAVSRIDAESQHQSSIAPLYIGIAHAADRNWFEEFNSFCRQKNASWIRLALDDDNRPEIGPLFGPLQRACIHCFFDMRSGAQSSRLNATSEGDETALRLCAVLAAIALEPAIQHNLDGFWESFVTRRYDLRSLRCDRLPSTSVPGCSWCRPAHSSTTRPSPLTRKPAPPLMFEDYIDQRISSKISRPFILSRDSSFRDFPDHPEYPLPEPIFTENGLWSSNTLSLNLLSTILRLSCGFRSFQPSTSTYRRWAPSSGDMGAVDAYLVVRIGMKGLPAGIYFYEAKTHVLSCLEISDETTEITLWMKQNFKDVGSAIPPIALLLVGRFDKLAPKYGPFGYRLLHFDTGVAMTFSISAAEAGGARAIGYSIGSGERNRLLRIEHMQIDELACGIVALWPGSDESQQPSFESLPPEKTTGPQISATEGDMLLRRLVAQSLQSPCRQLTSFNDNASEILLQRDQDNETLASDFLSLLQKRKTVREFDSDPLPAAVLKQTVGWLNNSLASKGTNTQIVQAIRYRFLVTHVIDFHPGIYRFDVRNGNLVFEMPLPPSSVARKMFRQSDLSLAPLALCVLSDMRMVQQDKTGGAYQALLVAIGASMSGLWLDLLKHGFDAAIVAGIKGHYTRKLLGIQHAWLSPSLLLNIGRRVFPPRDNLLS